MACITIGNRRKIQLADFDYEMNKSNQKGNYRDCEPVLYF